jgi:hypothetical protein
MNSITAKSDLEHSILIPERENVNLVDLIFTKDFHTKETNPFEALGAQEEPFDTSQLSVSTILNFSKLRSFRINPSKSRFLRQSCLPLNSNLKEALHKVRHRRRSFDASNLCARRRICDLIPTHKNDRAISNEVDYLKNVVIDRLVGISYYN